MVGKDLIMATLFGSGGGSSGSGGGGGVKITSGTIQVAEDTVVTHPNYYEVEHGLGVMPDLIVVINSGTNVITSLNYAMGSMIQRRILDGSGNTKFKTVATIKNEVHGQLVSENMAYFATQDVFFIGRLGNTLTAIISANAPLDWYAFKWEE